MAKVLGAGECRTRPAVSIGGSHVRRSGRTWHRRAVAATRRVACHGAAGGGACAAPPAAKARLERIEHIIVIYAENRSFDHLYGLFPGANGIANATPEQYTQVDRDGTPLPQLPPVWKGKDARSGVSAAAAEPAVSHRRAADRPAAVAARARARSTGSTRTGADQRRPQRPLRRGVRRRRLRDGLLRRLDSCRCGNGRRNTRSPTTSSWRRIRRFVHQSLLADLRVHAARPKRAGQPARAGSTSAAGSKRRPDSPASALRRHLLLFDGSVTPDGYVGQHRRSRRTSRRRAAGAGRRSALRRPVEAHAAAADDEDHRRHAVGEGRSRGRGTRAGGTRRSRTACSRPTRSARSSTTASPAPSISSRTTSRSTTSRASRRAPRIASGTSRTTPISSPASTRGELPQVAFYKPQGTLNEHPGYTDVLSGDAHIAELIAKIRASPLWASTAIIVTYDENGGFWDHVAPPEGRPLGAGHAHPGDHRVAATRSAATSTTRPTTRRRSSSSSRAASGSSRCPACAPTPATSPRHSTLRP